MAEDRSVTGFKPHRVAKGDGRGWWELRAAEYRMISGRCDGHLMPYGVAQMANGEVILIAGMQDKGEYACVAFVSGDRGDSWGDAIPTGAYGRPLTFGYLGGGSVVFGNELLGKPPDERRKALLYFSHDHGRTWEGIPYPLVAKDGRAVVTTEGQIHAEPAGVAGGPPRLWHLCVAVPPADWAKSPFVQYLRRSTDGGRTWTDERRMDEWRYEAAYRGTTVERGTSEGSIIRAADGALVAAIRLDIHPRYWDVPHDDNLEGLAVSRSHDDGASWSPPSVLFEAGRHHPALHRLADGTLVMAYIVRVDVEGDRFASYRRGCEAIVSRDHGATWDLARRYVLDAYEFSANAWWIDGACGHVGSALLDDGSILTAYGNYHAKGIALVRWRL